MGRALATPLAADRGDEAAALHRAPRDRELLAALQAQVGEVAEGFVVVVADIGGAELAGREVVAPLPCGGAAPGLPRAHGAPPRGGIAPNKGAAPHPGGGT